TDTQVIYIDPTTGNLRHDRKLGYDVFNSQDEALNYITDDSRTICKSTTLHLGTRYLAWGLNFCYSTGNEIKCEQLVWVPKRSGQNVHFNTYVLYKDLGDAYRLFDEMPERNSVSWSFMVGEFDKAGDYMKCFEIFREYVRMMFDMCCDCGKVGDCYF
nr:probable phosphoinositide phosphatase SAC9 [Tanacetum cinerariifolium]GFA20436.1 probable phosphoinositide phosphatase SAC9 [Tanacetum cinerariifolium]